MKRFVTISFASAVLLLSALVSTAAQAQDFVTINGTKVYGTCIGEYDKYENDPDHRAFAISRNGQYCGWAYGYDTVAAAERTAMTECRKGGRGCKIIASR